MKSAFLSTLQHQMSQHQRLSELRIKLLHLHKLLLETERITYEQVRGQVSGGELLQLVINHEQFAWLHRLSALIIQIDELSHADEPVTSEAIAAIDSDKMIDALMRNKTNLHQEDNHETSTHFRSTSDRNSIA